MSWNDIDPTVRVMVRADLLAEERERGSLGEEQAVAQLIDSAGWSPDVLRIAI
jgi:hypothetical protein